MSGVVKVKPGAGYGCHDVFLDGERVGEIIHREDRYNLVRVYVNRYYVARVGGAALRDSYGEQIKFQTLRDARAAVTEALMRARAC